MDEAPEHEMELDSEFLPAWHKAERQVVWQAIHSLQQNLEGFVAYHEENMNEQDINAVCAAAEKTKALLHVLWRSMAQ